MSDTKVKREPERRNSADLVEAQIDKLKSIFPEALSEGKVDFDKLRTTLGDVVGGGKFGVAVPVEDDLARSAGRKGRFSYACLAYPKSA